MSEQKASSESRFDAALGARLRKLDALPVDTTGLERGLRGKVPMPRRKARWVLRLAAMAAGLILMGSVGLVLLLPGGEVMASPVEIARIHQQMVAGEPAAMKASNVDGVNAAIRAQWGDFPGMPQVGGSAKVQVCECCTHIMGDKKNARMAFVMLEAEGHKVSMAVAKAKDVASPKGGTMECEGMTFSVQKVGELNMVMTECGARWICLTGDLPAEKLMDIAGQFVKD